MNNQILDRLMQIKLHFQVLMNYNQFLFLWESTERLTIYRDIMNMLEKIIGLEFNGLVMVNLFQHSLTYNQQS